MKPDIQNRLQKDFVDDFMKVVEEINKWDAETKGLLGDRILRATIQLANGNLEEFKRIKKAAKRDYRDVLLWAEYDEFRIQIRDFNKPFGEEMVPDQLEQRNLD